MMERKNMQASDYEINYDKIWNEALKKLKKQNVDFFKDNKIKLKRRQRSHTNTTLISNTFFQLYESVTKNAAKSERALYHLLKFNEDKISPYLDNDTPITQALNQKNDLDMAILNLINSSKKFHATLKKARKAKACPT